MGGVTMIRVISLGAGVQSTTMALMAAHGEFGEMPDCAVFADTGWEPLAVYNHLDWLVSSNVLPFPVYRVTGGNIRADIISRSNSTGGRFASVPWFLKMPNGKQAMGRRQCTKEYKLYPVRRQVRAMLGGRTPKGGAEVWIGISTDEALRMKPSSVQYIVNRWPLIERELYTLLPRRLKPPAALDAIADKVLRYRPKPQSKPAKKRQRRARKVQSGNQNP